MKGRRAAPPHRAPTPGVPHPNRLKSLSVSGGMARAQPSGTTEVNMFGAAITFLIIAIVAAVFGFGGIAGTAVGLAKIVFFVALILAVIGFVMGRRGSV
jgi:uncharacterized membrane protein YtjA (UPF0391 family)